MKLILKILLIILLTIITQIGGFILLISFLILYKNRTFKFLKVASLFIALYLFSTFLIVPLIAPIFGREKINESAVLEAHSLFYKLANRNYIKPALNKSLETIALKFDEKHKGMKLVYLDANFPFINSFPLLPHLSHNDGKKIDISLVYENAEQQLTNEKPSFSGYGVFSGPLEKEYNQIEVCKEKSYWQYDFTKYLTLGTVNKNLKLSEKTTQDLIKIIISQENIGKLFIEPHLKNRMNLTYNKVRYHGCQAVRHDDHIHFQLK